MQAKIWSFTKTALTYLFVFVVVFYGNRLIQNYLGDRLMSQTDEKGLVSLDYHDALIASSEKGKPVLFEISAAWCGSCRSLHKNILSQQEVIESINDNYVYTRIDLDSDEGQNLAQKYAIRGVPTVLVLNKSGGIIDRVRLSKNKQDFLAQL